MSEYIVGTDNHEQHWLTGEQIVRCRDCRFWATEHHFTGGCTGKEFDPDGFCAWGERKEDDNERVRNI